MEKTNLLNDSKKKTTWEAPTIQAIKFVDAPIMADSARCCGSNGFLCYDDYPD